MLAAGGVEESQREALLDHISACSNCSLELSLVMEAQPELDALSGAAVDLRDSSTRPRTGTGRLPRWVRVMAPALIVLVIALVWVVPVGQDDSTNTDLEQLRGSDTDITPANESILSAAPESISWEAAAGEARYRVEILYPDATQAWISEWQEGSTLRVDEDLAELLDQGGTWLWRVDVQSAGGKDLGPFWFRIER